MKRLAVTGAPPPRGDTMPITGSSARTVSDPSPPRIDQLAGPAAQAYATVEHLLDEYVRWCIDRLLAQGADLGDPSAAVDRHNQAFRDELPNLLGARGRLLIAVTGDQVAGVGALKPVDAATAEVKRMYVRPSARGLGLGRALLQRLMADATTLGYEVARLETAAFMAEAQSLYRSLGFTDTPEFDNSEASLSGFQAHTVYMQRILRHPRLSAGSR
jgi:ribosomal protein S18 acetylase RimI-like enzyme